MSAIWIGFRIWAFIIMTRRVACTQSRLCGNFFVLIVLGVITLVYFSVMLHYTEHLEDRSSQLFLAVLHLSLFMLVWSFVQAMLTDPGEVPPFWGFHMGDSEQKRRRYCLMCHVFKPERCHHCSACNRCVLNMDHHCPWINNCVGFYNRKFFMLLLVYVLLTTYLVAAGMTFPVWNLLNDLYVHPVVTDYKPFLIVCGYALDVLLAGVISMFFRFHLHLVSTNTTTIETMDKAGHKPGEVVST